MKPLTGHQIRTMWLDFFVSKGHVIIPSANLIPFQDPTLLWINSGVAAIKKYFDGSEIPSHRRLTNAQKSLRTNDIEQVGYTARHHTFFEMLGNFSIGDYFRDEVIPWAWELLTSPTWFALDPKKLYMTYSPLDEATKRKWLQCGVDEAHLIPLEGNFWEIGEGPCGPDTEIFFDRGEAYDPQKLGVELLRQEINNDRYVEIWNIVFSQFNAVSGVKREHYKELPSKNIDTGAGLERLACVMQGTETNFETDLFFPIIQHVQSLTDVPYQGKDVRSYRVIADHIRTLTATLADGAVFSNEGRGYVLRRILRRALRYGRKLGLLTPFLSSLVKTAVAILQDAYPNVLARQSLIEKMIHQEELKFISTLNHGESLLKSMLEKQPTLSGHDAFKLYDTFGFPIELTLEIAQEQGQNVDMEAFNLAMQEQKERARQARAHVDSMAKQSPALMAFSAPSRFDYEAVTLEATVIGLFVDGEAVEELEEGWVILDQTPFYAESGGQISDLGTIRHATMEARVHNVQKAPQKQPMHLIQCDYGSIKLGDKVIANIDTKRRYAIRQHHSAVHLLQASLKRHIGDHVLQQGSFVGPDYARFDFSQPEKIQEETLRIIEADVNEMIQDAVESTTEILPIDEAKKTGATAPFDEKYGDMVRIVTLGPRSKEFCGGTHVKNTAEIGAFAIVSEESIAAGVRRIQVVAGKAAYAHMKQKELMLASIQHQLQASSPVEIRDRLKALIQEKETLKSTVSILEKQQIKGLITSLTITSSPLPHLAVDVGSLSRNLLGQVMDELKVKYPESILILMAEDHGQFPLVIYVHPRYQTPTRTAGLWMKKLATAMGGSGGGRPDLAFGSGKLKIYLSQWVKENLE